MLKRIKSLALSIGIFSLIAAPFSLTTAVYAATNTTNQIQNCLSSGSNLSVDEAAQNNCNANNGTSTSVDSILKLVINVFSAIVGFIAVIMIIIGGVKYITSGGESSNISGAKNTIVYAIIGLIIVAVAQIIVHFVLGKIASNTGTGGSPASGS